jgi:hypothetical protein
MQKTKRNLSCHIGIKIKISKRDYRKYTITWRLNNMLSNNQWSLKSEGEIKKSHSQLKMKTPHTRIFEVQ